jgi:hypothetical protein
LRDDCNVFLPYGLFLQVFRTLTRGGIAHILNI